MIDASYPVQRLDALIRRLTASARDIGEERASQIAARPVDRGHPWRSATALWPDISREQY